MNDCLGTSQHAGTWQAFEPSAAGNAGMAISRDRGATSERPGAGRRPIASVADCVVGERVGGGPDIWALHLCSMLSQTRIPCETPTTFRSVFSSKEAGVSALPQLRAARFSLQLNGAGRKHGRPHQFAPVGCTDYPGTAGVSIALRPQEILRALGMLELQQLCAPFRVRKAIGSVAGRVFQSSNSAEFDLLHPVTRPARAPCCAREPNVTRLLDLSCQSDLRSSSKLHHNVRVGGRCPKSQIDGGSSEVSRARILAENLGTIHPTGPLEPLLEPVVFGFEKPDCGAAPAACRTQVAPETRGCQARRAWARF